MKKLLIGITIIIVLIIAVNLLFGFGSFDGPEVFDRGPAITGIRDGLMAVKMGGETLTKSFGLFEGEKISGWDFEQYGFSKMSIVFAIEPEGYVDRFGVTTNIRNGVSYIEYSEPGSLRVMARVICEASGTELEKLLDEYKGVITNDLCLIDDSVSPCCVVIIEEPLE